MMKDNIITIDWTDEVIAKTALTHDGKLCDTHEPDSAACTQGRPITHAKAA